MLGLTKDEEDDLQLRKICDYGADAHLRDQNVIPRFKIMGCEVDLLKRYMAENHPTVPYQFDYPTGQKCA